MNKRAVETVFVFDRHAATDLSVAYGILLPERAIRPIPSRGASSPPVPSVAGQEGRLARDQHEPQREPRLRRRSGGQLELDLG